ncbi:MAG: hypothetical protein LBG21_06690 [Campylobacteraceae bacterium]|jgi:hypothetical protein|nr:hypothetical protein [Campylobacteraceae bacterium]
MRILKIFFIVVFIVICFFTYSDYQEYTKGHSIKTYISNFIKNMIKKSKFETEYFIIDLPKFHWTFHANSTDNRSMLPFFGVIEIIDNEIYTLPGITVIGSLKVDNARDIVLNYNKETCDVFEAKSNQFINNFEVETYDCIDITHQITIMRLFVYKDEFFALIPYLDIFKPQYDKFFEGVRLKE